MIKISTKVICIAISINLICNFIIKIRISITETCFCVLESFHCLIFVLCYRHFYFRYKVSISLIKNSVCITQYIYFSTAEISASILQILTPIVLTSISIRGIYTSIIRISTTVISIAISFSLICNLIIRKSKLLFALLFIHYLFFLYNRHLFPLMKFRFLIIWLYCSNIFHQDTDYFYVPIHAVVNGFWSNIIHTDCITTALNHDHDYFYMNQQCVLWKVNLENKIMSKFIHSYNQT